MADEAPFLIQATDHPDDLVTLLVYADWLDDAGAGARAEFLRLQQQLLDMRHRQKGFSERCQKLVRLGKKFDPEWLVIVSRPRLTGTCWSGTDSRENHYVWRYLADGKLNYTSEYGTYQNGTWRQIGNHVIMETNLHYADYDGFVGADVIVGKAKNITGINWRWKVKVTTDPSECDYDEVDTTIYDDHIRRPAKRGRRRR